MAAARWIAEIKDKVAGTIIAALKAGNLPPWRKPWYDGGLIPRNGMTKRPYAGINVLYLQAVSFLEKYKSNDWFTWKTMKKLGGSMKEGEGSRSWIVIYYNWILKSDAINDEDRFPMMKYFRVYNREQLDDLPAPEAMPVLSEQERIASVDNFVTNIEINAEIKMNTGGRACYYPLTDKIEMPPYKDFKSAELFYATLYHELVHWTGSKERLNRDMNAFKTDRDTYAYEELVAEIGSAMLCNITKITGDTQPAEYIKSWIKLLENDTKAIFTSAGLAQKAVDYLIGKSGITFWEPDEEAA